MSSRTPSSSSISDNRRMSINDVMLPPNLVKGLSVQVLKELQRQSDATFFEYFEGLNLEEVKRVREKVQKIRDSNCEIAVKNLDFEPKLEEKRTLLVERCNELKRLQEEYDKKYLELKAIEGRKSHQAVEKELQQASRKVEQESEDFAADFIGGKSSLNLEDFSQEFVKQRTLYWLRKVKAEKMKELLANYRPTPMPRSSGPTSNMPIPSNPYSSPTTSLPMQHSPSSSVPPYPMDGRMPQPQSSIGGPFSVAAFASVPTSIPARPPKPAPYTGGQYRMNQHKY